MRPESLKTRIFLDGADPEETRQVIKALGLLDHLLKSADPAARELKPLARLLAREKRSEVIAAHIRAYVGDLSLDMGEAGTKALGILAALSNRGQFPTGSLLPASDQSC